MVRRDASRTQFIDGALVEDDISNSQDFDRFNPAFTANYHWTDDLSTYAKVATGYRAGGSSESGIDFSQTYGPEKVTNYELGLKSYWLERRVRANAALFRMDYQDMQIATSPDGTKIAFEVTGRVAAAICSTVASDAGRYVALVN